MSIGGVTDPFITVCACKMSRSRPAVAQGTRHEIRIYARAVARPPVFRLSAAGWAGNRLRYKHRGRRTSASSLRYLPPRPTRRHSGSAGLATGALLLASRPHDRRCIGEGTVLAADGAKGARNLGRQGSAARPIGERERSQHQCSEGDPLKDGRMPPGARMARSRRFRSRDDQSRGVHSAASLRTFGEFPRETKASSRYRASWFSLGF